MDLSTSRSTPTNASSESLLASTPQAFTTGSAFSRAEVIAWCHNPDREIISNDNVNPEVVKLGHLAIKHGRITPMEGMNQREAYRLLNPSIIRVPQVFDSFQSDGEGYLIMEYISAPANTQFMDDACISALTKALNHLHTFRGSVPGPVAGGPSKGLLWNESQVPTFQTKEDLQQYMNDRLVDQSDCLQLQDVDLVFSHLDIAPRNFRLLDNGAVCLFDWESSGYYPRFFELCALRLNNGDNGGDSLFSFLLEQESRRQSPLVSHEQRYFELVLRVVWNGIRFPFIPSSRNRNRNRKRRKIDRSAMEQERPKVIDNGSPITRSTIEDALLANQQHHARLNMLSGSHFQL